MKRNYLQPSTKVVNVKATSSILSGSGVRSISSSAGIGYGGGNSGVARTREYNGWGDDWDEEW